jgi:hypothetical protein
LIGSSDNRQKKTHKSLNAVLLAILKRGVGMADEPVEYHDLHELTMHKYARLFRQLRKQGTPIPTNDLWIAALALQHDLLLFTRDTHINHLPQLPVI